MQRRLALIAASAMGLLVVGIAGPVHADTDNEPGGEQHPANINPEKEPILDVEPILEQPLALVGQLQILLDAVLNAVGDPFSLICVNVGGLLEGQILYDMPPGENPMTPAEKADECESAFPDSAPVGSGEEE